MGAELSGLQFYEESGPKAADRAESDGSIQREDPGVDATDAGRERGENGRGVGPVSSRVDQTPSVLEGLETWTRRRLRSAIWKQWKRGTVRFAELRKRGVGQDLAATTAGSAHGPWRLANSRALAYALSNAYFDSLGIPRLTGGRCSTRRTAGCGPACPVGVTGNAGDSLPMFIQWNSPLPL
jgi:hypothetical protein